MTQAGRRSRENEDRLGMRLSPDLKKKVDYAAQLKGIPTAGYVKTILSDAADKTIREHEFIELTRKDRETFIHALLKPLKPSKKSIEAARRYKQQLGL
ncbi:MAG: DUF1778 domain-containing protein [Candidatus Obscuribacterales bacterium]|nr:DUF1778 domain-containing protein [Candidatus Obscuribacterales bacterium]